MNDCRTCGRKIRYRVMKMTVNRKRGVGGWLETEDQPQCPCLKDFVADKMRSDKRVPHAITKMIDRWNTENPQ